MYCISVTGGIFAFFFFFFELTLKIIGGLSKVEKRDAQ